MKANFGEIGILSDEELVTKHEAVYQEIIRLLGEKDGELLPYILEMEKELNNREVEGERFN